MTLESACVGWRNALVIVASYVWQIIENSDMRFGDQLEELKDLVCHVFPPPQGEPAAEVGNEDNEETEVADGWLIDVSDSKCT